MATAASADPLVLVRGGSLDIERPRGQLSLTGDRGLTLDAVVDTHFGVWGPAVCAFDFCGEGRTVPLSALWSGLDIRNATASLDGWSGPLAGDAGPSAHVEFHAGSIVLPAVSAAPLTFVEPFTFSGLLFLAPVGGERTTLFGSGWATVFLTSMEIQGTPVWRIEQMRYDFSANPIPEPSTLILVGGAAMAMAARRLRRRSGSG